MQQVHLGMPITQFERSSSVPANEPLSHYMKLKYFKDLLERKAMFFPLSTHLRKVDPREGVLPPKEAQFLILDAIHRFRNPPIGSPDYIQMVNQINNILAYVDNVCIKCFHRSASENMEMWNEYVPDNDGIMIRTTYTYLESSFRDNEEQITSASIRYVYYNDACYLDPKHYPYPVRNTLVPHIIKSKKYENEKEFRLMYCPDKNTSDWDSFWRSQNNFNGLFLKFNPRLLLKEVIVSPKICEKQFRTVQGLVEKHCPIVPISRSSFDERKFA